MIRGSSIVGESSEESTGKDPDVVVTVGKDPDVAVTTGKAAAGVLSQGYVVAPSIHGAYHSKEPPGT
nr:hypothetical protein CFP56_47359 [Quercus suber]